MSGNETLHLTLHVDTTASPIEGTVVDEAAGTHRFAGWMELVARIDEAIAADHAAAPQHVEA